MNNEQLKDFTPDGFEGFSNTDEIVVARVFLDKARAALATSQLRLGKIPHFLADGNGSFAENVMNGERLFIRKQDLEQVSLLLDGETVSGNGQEDSFKSLTYIFMGAFLMITILAILYVSLFP